MCRARVELTRFHIPGPPPSHPPYFTSTQDLLTRFQLTPAYDKYVRAYVTPVGQQPQPGATDKGKGKEREPPLRDAPKSSPAATPGAVAADDEDGKGEKKAKNSYKHLIKGIPGKHSTKKDDFLMTTMQVPPKQRIRIVPFDLKTQREAFSVSLEGLKGWNLNALIAESPQAREDRKKRKELKRQLAKAQSQAAQLPTPGAPPDTPAPVSASTPGGSARTGTPKPVMLPTGPGRPSTQHPQANSSQSRGRTPVGIGTPRSVSTPGVSVPAAAQLSTSTSAPVLDAHRGMKRERESDTPVNGVQQIPNGNGTVRPAGIVSAKAGSGGVRPRPIKKQRQDLQGNAREMPVQQPTPHA
ncbi:hypothetical protein CERSUDRAFT_67993 [Gelatoporia subvermispora B]|uniref:Mediator of RNA polymerase II transcription subunit 19 n=1 Tax=Ceriporiopsis subvermispora (strain B) TaxID=914234 RepID=M2R570_CERS8|nr:hypothetical protein CERSUDRAFT_67993 [Gelatoporia subvermispora B]